MRQLKHATRVVFGTDSSLSAPGTIWDHMRLARQRGDLDDQELFDSVTSTARMVWNVQAVDDDGITASFVVARRLADDPCESFYRITPADLMMVVHAGLHS